MNVATPNKSKLPKWKIMEKLCNKNGENLDGKSDIIEINKNRK